MKTDKAHRCEKCSKTFTQIGSKNRHIMKTHKLKNEEGQIYECCGRQYKYHSSFERHRGIKHPVLVQLSKNCVRVSAVSYECDTCQKSFKRKDHLIRHIFCKHNSDLQSNYVCHHCNRKFAVKSNLQRHLKVHVLEFTKDDNNGSTSAGDVFTIMSANIIMNDASVIASPTTISSGPPITVYEDATTEAVFQKTILAELEESKLEIQRLNDIIKQKDELLKKILAEDQIRALETGHLIWSSETLLKALRLGISSSIDGYQRLLETGYPLPI